MLSQTPTDRPAPPPTDRWQLAWLLLGVFYLLFGLLYSVIQPPTALPDEGANMQYVRFLGTQSRLPVWEPSGGGAGGYETQHPPLAYALQALAWRAAAGLPDNLRWHAVRWFMVLLGLGLLPVTARLGRRLFPDDPPARFTLAATVQLLPLSLLYLCHANPDGVGLLLSALGLLLAARIYGDPGEGEAGRLPWLAGAVGALAALAKLSVLPVLPVLLAAQAMRPDTPARARRARVAVILGVALVGSGWWYVRNLLLYGQVFIHTAGRLGTGLDLGARAGYGYAAKLTLTETFWSAWAQRGWFPPSLEPLLDGGVALMVLLALAGFLFVRRPADAGGAGSGPSPFLLRLCFFWLLFVFVSQQVAFWTVDVELNAGGRYLLAALPATATLLVAGVRRLGPRPARAAFPAWLALLLAMNVASAYNIVNVLVPHYFPGWKMLEFPGGMAGEELGACGPERRPVCSPGIYSRGRLTSPARTRYTARTMIFAVTTLSLRRRARALGSAPATRRA